MADIDENLNDWLRDAHAMEKQAEKMLTAQADRLENYPELRARIQRHIEETRSQADRLERCLEARGTSTSGTKDIMGKATAMMQGIGGMFAGDEVVKGTMAGFVFEEMEIASYRVLTEAANAAGDIETARTCEEICREEEEMAAWLSQHMPQTVRTYLQRAELSRDDAKR